jgi:hypothetical protein
VFSLNYHLTVVKNRKLYKYTQSINLKMNDLKIPNTQEEVIQNLQLEGFTQEETLIARSILLRKAGLGLVARLNKGISTLAIEHDAYNDFRKLNSEFLNNYRELHVAKKELIGEYATLLGISEKRYKEIEDFVYDSETNL